MPKVFNLLSPRTPWRLFLYFVNNLKTVGFYCGVCRRCGFLPSGVHGAENRRSHVGPSATRRATHRHEASPIAAFIKGISLNMQEYFISRLWNRENTRIECLKRKIEIDCKLFGFDWNQ